MLSAGKEVTRIKGATPANDREAKEALLRGKLPEVAGLHLSWREQDTNFVLKAEQIALFGKLSRCRPCWAAQRRRNQAPARKALRRPPPRRKRHAQPRSKKKSKRPTSVTKLFTSACG